MNEPMAQFAPPGQPLAPPRAAAIAGLIFSLLMLVSLGIIRVAVPEILEQQSTVNARFGRAITLALHLVPFAGLAFLWFVGVLRNRIGASEDQFFGTVFLGSGLLFVASLFAATALSLILSRPVTQKRRRASLAAALHMFRIGCSW